MTLGNDGADKTPQEITMELVAVARAQATVLTETLDSMSKKLKEMRRYIRNSRKFIIGLAVSLILDIALSALTIYVAVGVNDAQNSVQHVNLTQCIANNMSRAQDLVLWSQNIQFQVTFLNDIDPPGTKVTPIIEKELADLRAKLVNQTKTVNEKDAQRDCVRIYG